MCIKDHTYIYNVQVVNMKVHFTAGLGKMIKIRCGLAVQWLLVLNKDFKHTYRKRTKSLLGVDAPIKFYIFKNWSMALYNLSVYDSYNHFFAIHNYTKHYFRKRNIMLLSILKRFSKYLTSSLVKWVIMWIALISIKHAYWKLLFRTVSGIT